MAEVDRDQFLDLGTHCSDKTCNQLDFLPFKCSSCSLPYCVEHWKPAQHSCTSYDPSKDDNRVPECPLCNSPVSFPLNTDPNIAMDKHLSTICQVLNPNAPKPKSANTCNAKKCNVKMVVPIICQDCGSKFCASHRYGKDHQCEGKASGNGKLLGAINGGPRNLSGLAALRRAQQALKSQSQAIKKSTTGTFGASTSAPAVASRPVLSSPINNKPETEESGGKDSKMGEKLKNKVTIPISKTDRRAQAERDSARKALEARAKKGLLTEEEKIKYATEQARQQSKTEDKCCCM